MYLMIDNYDSFTYNLYALFKECGADVTVIKNDEFIPADEFEGIILSPGPSTPKNAGTTLQYIQTYKGKKPILGVCLGMQSIAYVMGYNIISANSIKHGKIDTISITSDSILFRGVPQTFKAVRYHSLAVDIDEKFVTSRSTDNTVMSIEDKENKLFGVQFHPESILSEYGATIISNMMEFSKLNI